MGKVKIVYRIYPEENYDIEKLAAELSKMDKIKAVEREPIGFGVEVIKVAAVLEDKVDNPQAYEEGLRKVPGVKNVEDVDVTLIS
jgi:translation elongation factor EF-1beta